MAGGIVKRPQLETVDNYAELFGPFNYKAGTLSGGTIVIAGQIANLSLDVDKDAAAVGQFTIDGGDTITIRKGMARDWTPRTKLQNPTMIIWVAGSMNYFIEWTA
jgi:hypothetical protein